LQQTTTDTADNKANRPVVTLWIKLTGKLTTEHLEQFVSAILPTSIQVQLDQHFDKDSLNLLCNSAKSFCHVLLPHFKSCFLSCRAPKAIDKTSFRARQLQQLLKKYFPVDFRPLQGYQNDWETTDTIRADWKAITSA
jgi:hypothetical protein